jgi:hypothetical protein
MQQNSTRRFGPVELESLAPTPISETADSIQLSQLVAPSRLLHSVSYYSWSSLACASNTGAIGLVLVLARVCLR